MTSSFSPWSYRDLLLSDFFSMVLHYRLEPWESIEISLGAVFPKAGDSSLVLTWSPHVDKRMELPP